MIIVDGILLHSITSVLTFGSNSNTLSPKVLSRFVHGYNIMEKIQMVGFFVQELVLSAIYIKETVRLLRLSESVEKQGELDGASIIDHDNLHSRGVKKTMYQLIAINAIIIAMDIVLLGVEFANLYLIETTLKGVVYSIKLKLEFAVLGKLVQLVRTNSSNSGQRESITSAERRAQSTGLTLEKTSSGVSMGRVNGANGSVSGPQRNFPDFVDPRRISQDVTHAEPHMLDSGWEDQRERWKRRSRAHTGMTGRGSWIDEEMVRLCLTSLGTLN
jgi:hypothetical protein